MSATVQPQPQPQLQPLAFEAQCQQYLQQHREDKHILGLSGGRDSVALFFRLLEEGVDIHACHLNHGLRGEEAEKDAQFCRELCERHGVSYALECMNIPALAQEQKQSFEQVARQKRREFLMKEAERKSAKSIILGQHADDQAETIIFKLARGGAGLRGIRAVEEQHGIYWLRPLLRSRRGEISQYLEERAQGWREDRSNADSRYVRNAIRHEIIPALSGAMGRDVIPIINRSAELEDERRKALGEAIELMRGRFYDPQGRIYVPGLREVGEELGRVVIHGYMEERGVRDVSRRVVGEVYDLVREGAEGSVVNLAGGWRIRRAHRRLFVEE